MTKLYVVYYYGGQYEDKYETIIFATINKNKAKKYVERFNEYLRKLCEKYSTGEIDEIVYRKRYDMINFVDGCAYTETELRE